MMRLSIVLRAGLAPGVAMNACGHLALGMAGVIDAATLAVRDFRSPTHGLPIATLSDHPIIVLKAASSDMLQLLYRDALMHPELVARVFCDTFFKGSVDEQANVIASIALDDLALAGVALFGPHAAMSGITRRLPLFR